MRLLYKCGLYSVDGINKIVNLRCFKLVDCGKCWNIDAVIRGILCGKMLWDT